MLRGKCDSNHFRCGLHAFENMEEFIFSLFRLPITLHDIQWGPKVCILCCEVHCTVEDDGLDHNFFYKYTQSTDKTKKQKSQPAVEWEACCFLGNVSDCTTSLPVFCEMVECVCVCEIYAATAI